MPIFYAIEQGGDEITVIDDYDIGAILIDSDSRHCKLFHDR